MNRKPTVPTGCNRTGGMGYTDTGGRRMADCSSCGKELVEGDQFCRVCGVAVAPSGPGAAPAGTGAGTPQPGTVSPPGSQLATPPGGPSLREKAEKRVKQRTELLTHIGSYVVINAFLVVVWALSGAGYPWFLWVMAGWGLGLAMHAVSYFTGSKGDSSREKMIQQEMERMKRGNQ